MGANAQTSVPTFTAGEILTAANMNISARTGIPVFADSTARDAAFGGTGEKTLAEGQFAFLEDTNATQVYDGSVWQAVGGGARIGQVVSTVKSDTFTSSAVAYTDITGLSATITPTLATSKILVLVSLSARVDADANLFFRQMRDAVAINIGDAAGSRTQTSVFQYVANSSYNPGSCSWNFLDSPATTSATTYQVQGFVSSGSMYINRSASDANNANNQRATANITLMEVIV